MPISLASLSLGLLFGFSCYLVHKCFQSYIKIFKRCCCDEDFLVKIPYSFMFLSTFLKFDHSKYNCCYIPLEPEFCVDFDFPGFKSLMITHKKYKLPKHSHWLSNELFAYC